MTTLLLGRSIRGQKQRLQASLQGMPRESSRGSVSSTTVVAVEMRECLEGVLLCVMELQRVLVNLTNGQAVAKVSVRNCMVEL
jgi:hypothetical protein